MFLKSKFVWKNKYSAKEFEEEVEVSLNRNVRKSILLAVSLLLFHQEKYPLQHCFKIQALSNSDHLLNIQKRNCIDER